MPRHLLLSVLIIAAIGLCTLTVSPPVYAKSLSDLGLNNDQAAAVKKLTKNQRRDAVREQRNRRMKTPEKNVDETRTVKTEKAKARKPKSRAHKNARQKAPSNKSGQGLND